MKRNENKKSLTKKIVAGTGLALLLALVGYTGANTYAKYIDQVNVPSQSATVAKWGHVVNVQDGDMFGTNYSGSGLAEEVDGVGVSVSAQTSAGNIVAPGTTGSMSFSISGTAEVLSQLTINVAGTEVGLFDGENTEYPVKWTLTKDGSTLVNGKTLAEVVSHLDAYDEEIAIGQKSTHAGNYTLSWAWAFETAGSSTLNDRNNYGSETKLSFNGVDTIMGWLADGSNPTDTDGYVLVDAAGNPNNTWSFELTIIVEQIQKD